MKNDPLPSDYTWNIQIPSYDVGENRRLKLSSMLKLQQEVGELHFALGGLGYEKLYDDGFAFVLTRTNSIIYRAPVFTENIQLCTWHRGAKGAQFFRCYRFLDEKGNILIDSITAFALVDTIEHKLLRPKEFDRYGVVPQMERKNTCPDPKRWKHPETMNVAGIRTIRWSDIDYNGHLNNSVYADISCDVMPGGMKNKRITEFSIGFLHEAFEGDQVSLKTAVIPADAGNSPEQGKEAYITGDLTNESCFEARFRYLDEK